MRAGPDTMVTLTYALSTPDGHVVDTTNGLGKLSMLYTQAQAIPGLHQALKGLKSGDTFDLDLTPEMAFGRRNPAMVRQLPRGRFPADANLYVGAQMVVQTERPSGYSTMYVTAIEGESVSVDLHHPLAGVGLHLTGTLENVRKATADEISESRPPTVDTDDD